MPKNEQNSAVLDAIAQLNADSADKMTNWSDLYTLLYGSADAYMARPCMQTASYAVAVLVSFVAALEELPDEGDVVVIARKLNEILLTRPERTGVEFASGSAYSAEEVRRVVSGTKHAATAEYDVAKAAEHAEGKTLH